MGYFDLTKNQRDTIVKKGKEFGIKVRKSPDIPNALAFEVPISTINVNGYDVVISYVTGKITFNPFNYVVNINNHIIDKKKDFYQLYNILNDIEEFLDWLKNYQDARMK